MPLLDTVNSFPGRIRQWISSRGCSNVPPVDEKSIIKLLIIGGTGQGKSTLVNYILSYALNKPMASPAIAIPTKYHPNPTVVGYRSNEQDSLDATASKTKQCTNYDVFVGGQICKWFRFIDTPGLNDTKGNAHDHANQAEILRGVIESKNLGAIIVIINGTNPRFTTDIKAILCQLKNNLPDSTLRNLIFVFTCSTASSCNFDLGSLKPFVACNTNTFYMNNTAFSANPAAWNAVSRLERNLLQSEWTMSMETIAKLLSMVAGMSGVSTDNFERMRELRDELKVRISQISAGFIEVQKLTKDVELAEVAKALNEDAIQRNKNFEKTVEIVETSVEQTEHVNTRCRLHTEIVCHVACTEGCTSDVAGCVCMAGRETCRLCACPAANHFHSHEIPVKKKVAVQQKLEAVYAAYTAAVDAGKALDADFKTKAGHLATLEAAMRQKLIDVEMLMRALKSICSGYNLIAELRGSLEKLEKDKKSLRNSATIKSVDEFIGRITQVAEKLSAE